MTVLDKALVFGGEQLEGVDEAGVEELGGTEAGQEGGNVLLLRDSPNLYIMILGQPDRNTGCKMTPNMRCGRQVLDQASTILSQPAMMTRGQTVFLTRG